MTEKKKRVYNKNFCNDCNRFMYIIHKKLGLCKKCLMRCKQLQAPKIPCADGCGELIPNIDKHGRSCEYLPGHKKRKRSRGLPKGKKLNSNGYISVINTNHRFVNNDGYIADHRWVYEQHYNCCLLSYTVIHHKDGDTINNNWSNLQAFFSNSIHMSETYNKNTSDRFCSDCGSNKTYINKKGVKVWNEIFKNIWLCSMCYLRYNRWIKKEIERSNRKPLDLQIL